MKASAQGLRAHRSCEQTLRGREVAGAGAESDGAEQFQQFGGRLLGREGEQFATTGLDLDDALGQTLFTDGQAKREAHEIGILELHARPVIAVVEDDTP